MAAPTRAARRVRGRAARAQARRAPATVLAVLGAGLSLFAIYWVFQPLAAQVYRPAFLAVALLLTFMVFGRDEGRPDAPLDWVARGGWRWSRSATRS